MRPTAFGVKALAFYATIITAYYVSPYTNLFFLLLSFLSILLIYGSFAAAQNIGGIEVHLLGLTPYAACRQHKVKINIKAPRRRRFHLNIELKIDGKRHHLGTIQMMRGEAEIHGLLPKMPRGIHAITVLRCHSDYPLGILRCYRRSPTEESLTVHPLPIEEGRSAHGGIVDEIIGRVTAKSGDMGPSGVREYRPGDPTKLIHWKASARRQGLVVKELESYAAAGIEIQLDRRCNQDAFEHALSLITALSFRARDAKKPLALHTQDSSQTYGEGHAPFGELLTLLAGLKCLETDATPPPSASPTAICLPQSHSHGVLQGTQS